MIKLVITDLDGTFLNSKGSFNHERFRAVKHKLDANGIQFAACTGKQCERVEELFGEDGHDIWILGDSATRIKYQGEFVHQSLIPNTLGTEILQRLKSLDLDFTVIVCTNQAAYIRNTRPVTEKETVRRSYTVVREVKDFSEVAEDIVKITIFDAEKRSFETIKEIQDFSDRLYMVASEAAWIDITNYGIHKGVTVQRLQKILGCSQKETVAFGDGFNDFELLENAGLSFAMGNAFEEVKAAADFVTKTNDEDGVLFTLEKLLAFLEEPAKVSF